MTITTQKQKWYSSTDPNAIQGHVIDDADGRSVAVTYEPKDAQLVAAAPTMLDALYACLETLQAIDGHGEMACDDLISNAKRAAEFAIHEATL